jgi:2-desacetyl-2-hydroxyethyl bacteriochlorophyllide A dehydrogenase
MRSTALEFAARGTLAFRELDEPRELSPTEVLVETEFTAMTNGTERHAFLTEHGYGNGTFPSRHGYQHVGRITAIGDKVSRFRPNEHVFYGNYTGHNGYNIVDENELLLHLPPEIDRRYSALFGVAGVALHSVRRMRVGPGDNVWVAGQGPIGHFLAQSARSAGAKVTVTDMIDKRLDAARECGAHVALNAGASGTVTRLKDGGPYDYIFDCCSAEGLLSEVFDDQLLSHGGTIGMMAVRDKVVYPWSMLHSTEARIETSCHFEADDLRVLLFLVQEGVVRMAPMVSHIVSIDDAPRMYEMLAGNSGDLLGVIFDWG